MACFVNRNSKYFAFTSIFIKSFVRENFLFFWYNYLSFKDGELL